MFRQRIVMIGEKEGGLFVAVEIVSSDFGVCGRLHPAAGHDGAEDRELAALAVRALRRSESRSTVFVGAAKIKIE